MDDREIVRLFFARDEQAIAHTSEKYGRKLRFLAKNIVEDEETARECENSTYFEAWNAIPPHDPAEYLFPFLARIARHLALNVCRSRNQQKRSAILCQLTEEMEQCLPGPGHLDDGALKEILNNFLANLPEKKRNIFLRRYWYMDSIDTIARRYAITQSSVKTTLFRTRNQLRTYLQEEGYNL